VLRLARSGGGRSRRSPVHAARSGSPGEWATYSPSPVFSRAAACVSNGRHTTILPSRNQ
jgi:hypothetical protein